MDFRTARLYLAAMTVLLGMAGTLAYFGPAPASGEAQAAAAQRGHVEASLGELLRDAGGALPAGMRFVHAHCACGRDTNDWGMVEVPPAEIPRIRKRIVRRYVGGGTGFRTASIVRTDDEMLPFREARRPAWWRPSDLTDPDVVIYDNDGGALFVFSQSAGRIYVLRWTV